MHRALLASWVLKEHLNLLGKLGCVVCCSGSVMLILHAPKAETVISRMEFEERLLDPGNFAPKQSLKVAALWCLWTDISVFFSRPAVFVAYILSVLLLLLVLIVWVAPAHGSSNIMVYICICSLLGSFTVPSSKGLGIVAKDIFMEGPPSSTALALFLALLAVLFISILTQFLFINKALARFSSNTFEAIYYVTFTSSVILASALLFKEWTALNVTDCLAMICGLATICVGVILLRVSQEALITWKKKTDWLEWDDIRTLVPYFSVDNSDLKTILLVLFYLQFRHYKVHCDIMSN